MAPSGPGPETLVIAEGARHPGPNWPSLSSGCPYGRGRSQKFDPGGRLLPFGHKDRDGEMDVGEGGKWLGMLMGMSVEARPQTQV